LPPSQLDIDIIRNIHDVDSATTYLFDQVPPSQILNDALSFSKESHKYQIRKSGEPYVVHPIVVAAIVVSITDDESMAIAALLHYGYCSSFA